ncbi:MAG: hypothetical protein VR64_07650 [Desulfatitalea sp. BRH_c12]|nr:MAG: hypothetical protein VR64_07650 [Desulfatitalea sp. BRH_c12]
MGIAARSARWARRASYSVRKGTEFQVKLNELCPRINAALNRPSIEFKVLRLSRVKTETADLSKAAAKRIVF